MSVTNSDKMNETNYQQSVFRRKCVGITEFGLFVFIIITLLLRLHLIFLLNINQDEFYFLSQVHRYLQGTLSSQFFTFHVHLFSWLPLIATNEVTQIFVARVFMYILGLGSCTFIYLTGRLFINKSGALFSVLCYLSISNVIVHGASFRFDPICVFLFLCSIYLLLKKLRSNTSVIAAGLNMAVSLMVSPKTIFYLPTIGAIFLFQILLTKNGGDTLKRITLFCVTLVVGFALAYQFHCSTLSGQSLASPVNFTRSLASRGILFHGFFPEPFYILMAVIENPFVWVFWLGGLTLLVRKLASRKSGLLSKDLLLLPLLIPIVSLAFYKYAFPYFYVFIISPAIVFSGILIDKIVEDFKSKGSLVLLIFVSIATPVIFGNFLIHYKRTAFDQTVSQREIVRFVHEIFPEPVPYIDRCSMISSFPKAGLHMTTTDMERYTEANMPIMRNILIKQKPVFILANIVFLDLSLPRVGQRDFFRNYPLLEKDYNTLKDNFIHHWGKLYVAGKNFLFDSDIGSQTFEILVPGTYTIEADGEVSFNGVVYEPGSRIRLEKATYTIIPQTNPMKVTLRWGEDLYKPSHEPSTQPIFLGYYLQALKMRH